MALNAYLAQVQRLLHNPTGTLYNTADLTNYINLARREIAMRTQCLRFLPAIDGPVTAISVTAAGSGYTAPTATITAPDFPSGNPVVPNGVQATAVPILASGTIASVSITSGGSGYFQPQIVINDPAGTGATASVTVGDINITNQGQEIYPFADIETFPNLTGVQSIFDVLSVSIIYANYRYSLPKYSFTTYQSSIRQYPFQYQYVPTVCAQLGQGTAGNLFLYPIPSQAYQMEWDCYGLPVPLVTDVTIEAIPDPWPDCVPYFAAYLAYLTAQRKADADGMKAIYDDFVHRYSAYSNMGRASNPYGRFLWPIVAGLSAASMLHGLLC